MHDAKIEDLFLTRRELLARCGQGLASLGLAGLLAKTELANASVLNFADVETIFL